MSSQDSSNSIPLVYAPTGQGYKLLELPPELVELLESADPPILTLHSSPTAAVLKTPNDKTYSLRQKNTSNALMLLEPMLMPMSSSSSTTTGSDAMAMPVIGMGAIATVHETVELVLEAGEAPAPRAKGKWHERFGKGR